MYMSMSARLVKLFAKAGERYIEVCAHVLVDAISPGCHEAGSFAARSDARAVPSRLCNEKKNG